MAASRGRLGRWRFVRLAFGVVLLGALAGGAYGTWYLLLRPAGPPAVALPSAGPTSSPGATGAPSSAAALADLMQGTWRIDMSIGSFSDFTSSFVGYRVQEQLATIGANVAVGRTPNVSGTLTIEGTAVTGAEITADLSSLRSDDDRRDGQLRRQGIETDRYPSATFRLSAPIEFDPATTEGETIHLQATGELTLHGVTRSVTVPLEGRYSGGSSRSPGRCPSFSPTTASRSRPRSSSSRSPMAGSSSSISSSATEARSDPVGSFRRPSL